MVFEEKEFSEISRNPCLYIYLDGDDVLYIGAGRSIGRAFESANEREIDSSARLLIRAVASEDDAKKLEALLIHKYHPIYNRYCPSCAYKHYSCRNRKKGITGIPGVFETLPQHLYKGGPKRLNSTDMNRLLGK